MRRVAALGDEKEREMVSYSFTAAKTDVLKDSLETPSEIGNRYDETAQSTDAVNPSTSQFGVEDSRTLDGDDIRDEVSGKESDAIQKGVGSLVANTVGDLQYLGNILSHIFLAVLNFWSGYTGPSSGFAVLSQADGHLHYNEAIQQHLHMSEFDSSASEVRFGNSFIQLPPRHIADMYIDGE